MTETKSKLYVLKPLIEKWPAVAKPEGHVPFKTKVFWTTLCLVLYYILANITIYGISEQRVDLFAQFRAILAGASGSLMHLGIGPIVTGSIIMQLFVGAKIINLDLTKKEDKGIYQGTQKIIVLGMIFVEAVPQVYGYLVPDVGLIGNLQDSGMTGAGALNSARGIIIFQLFLGAMIVFLMDELISKWGIGSGISLFIAAGVAQALFTGMFNWEPYDDGQPLDAFTNPPIGTFPMVWYVFTHASLGEVVHGQGFENVFIGSANFPNPIITLVGTIIIFMFVVYAEGTRIELPLAHGKVRGARGRYPIRLIYSSNIPVILIAALLANVNLFAILLDSHPTLSKIPFIGKAWWIGYYPDGQLNPSAIMGGAWYVTTWRGFQEWFLPLLDYDRYSGFVYGHEVWQILLKIAIYLLVYVGGSIMFAKFWIETTNMGPEAVAKQIQKSGMQIPGFRREPRVLRKVLERYIPTVTVIGGATVGALAAIADMIGTIGQASGTGVLLAVGIVMRMYEQIAKEQAMEMHPVLRGFFGAE